MTALQHPSHRVTRAAVAWSEELVELADDALWSMRPAEAGEALQVVTRLEAQLAELKTRILGQAIASDVGHDTGASSTVAWWAHTTRTTRAAANRAAKLADALAGHEPVRQALAAGTVLADQAAVIVESVDALPDDVPDWVPGAARDFLLDHAEHHDAKALRVLGRRVLDVIDPESADREEARRLEAEEADARAAAVFTIADDGHGKCHGRFTLPSLHGEMLKKHLTALAFGGRAVGGRAESRPAGEGSRLRSTTGMGSTTKEAMGQAFLEYIETRPGNSIPHSGGIPATVVVLMELDTLMGGLRAASLDTGGRISASEARRLACRAGIIPAVLGGPSQVLDLGRKQRFHTEPQRIAMTVRDRGCRAEGCTVAPGFCHAHHVEPWAHGGGTSVRDGWLLCGHHHRLIHDPAFQHSLDKHGQVRFTRRT